MAQIPVAPSNISTKNSELTMSHIQIANMIGHDRLDTVKISIERLAKSGVITFTSLTGPLIRGRSTTEYHVSERDSYVVVAQLSPEFTAKLVDEWIALKNPSKPVEFNSDPLLAQMQMMTTMRVDQLEQAVAISDLQTTTANLTHKLNTHGCEPGQLPHLELHRLYGRDLPKTRIKDVLRAIDCEEDTYFTAADRKPGTSFNADQARELIPMFISGLVKKSKCKWFHEGYGITLLCCENAFPELAA